MYDTDKIVNLLKDKGRVKKADIIALFPDKKATDVTSKIRYLKQINVLKVEGDNWGQNKTAEYFLHPNYKGKKPFVHEQIQKILSSGNVLSYNDILKLLKERGFTVTKTYLNYLAKCDKITKVSKNGEIVYYLTK